MILANISSNVISKSAIEIYERLKKDGLLICSGILIKDSKKIKNDMNSLSFSLLKEEIQGDWTCLIFKK
jgi:ribosomal protein L11 methylase PrmA